MKKILTLAVVASLLTSCVTQRGYSNYEDQRIKKQACCPDSRAGSTRNIRRAINTVFVVGLVFFTVR